MSTETCEWREDLDGVFETECGEAFQFESGGPVDNKMKFCSYCGKPLAEIRSDRDER